MANDKQKATVERLTLALNARNLDGMEINMSEEGNFLYVLVTGTAKPFPQIRIGKLGGIELPEIKSYPEAFEAAVNGDELLEKQSNREAKREATKAAEAQKAAGKTNEAPKVVIVASNNQEKAAFETGAEPPVVEEQSTEQPTA